MSDDHMDLITYLDSVGIDAHRVQRRGMDETGYNYINVDHQGRPMYGNTGASKSLAFERKEWPEGVYENLRRIEDGKPIVTAKAPAPKKESPK